MSLVLDEQRRYLSDTVHLTAFRAAVQEVIKQGDVVLDLDADTGILGLLACRAGAIKADSIERDVYLRHSPLFGSLDEAAKFVAEVTTRNSL